MKSLYSILASMLFFSCEPINLKPEGNEYGALFVTVETNQNVIIDHFLPTPFDRFLTSNHTVDTNLPIASNFLFEAVPGDLEFQILSNQNNHYHWESISKPQVGETISFQLRSKNFAFEVVDSFQIDTIIEANYNTSNKMYTYKIFFKNQIAAGAMFQLNQNPRHHNPLFINEFNISNATALNDNIYIIDESTFIKDQHGNEFIEMHSVLNSFEININNYSAALLDYNAKRIKNGNTNFAPIVLEPYSDLIGTYGSNFPSTYTYSQ